MKTETYLFINNDAQLLRDSFFQCMNGGGVAWPAGRGAMSHVACIIFATRRTEILSLSASPSEDWEADIGELDSILPVRKYGHIITYETNLR